MEVSRESVSPHVSHKGPRARTSIVASELRSTPLTVGMQSSPVGGRMQLRQVPVPWHRSDANKRWDLRLCAAYHEDGALRSRQAYSDVFGEQTGRRRTNAPWRRDTVHTHC